MKRIMFVCATILFALVLTAGAFVPSTENTAVKPAAVLQDRVPVKITDKKGKPIKIESLPRETQAQVERVKAAGRSLLEGGSQNITIHIECSYPPLRCRVEVLF